MAFQSKYGKKTVQGRPITGAATNMKSLPVGGADGSTQQAEGQIRNAPRPFGNPHLNPMQASGQVPSHQGFKQAQVHGRPSARGTRPGANTANSPSSGPISDRAILNGAGYRKPVNYAGHAVHVQLNKSVRVMRGPIPGAKPLVNNDDIFSAAGIKKWNASRQGL